MQEGHTVLDAIYKPSVIQTCENWKDIIIKEEANVAFSEAMAQKIPISIIGDPIKKSDKWIFIVELNPLDINTTAWLQTLSHVTVVTEQSMPQLMDFAIKLKNLEVTIEELDHIEEDRYEGIILTTPNSNNRCQIQLNIANPHLLNGPKLWVIDYSSFLYDLMKGNVDKALQIFDRIGLALLQEKLNPEEFTSNVATDKILEYPNFIFTLLDMLEKDHILNNIPEYQIKHINVIFILQRYYSLFITLTILINFSIISLEVLLNNLTIGSLPIDPLSQIRSGISPILFMLSSINHLIVDRSSCLMESGCDSLKNSNVVKFVSS